MTDQSGRGLWIVLGLLAAAGILVVVVLSAGRLVVSTLETGGTERRVLPDGFVGWATVAYGVPDAPELPVEGEVLVLRYPETGLLETSSA